MISYYLNRQYLIYGSKRQDDSDSLRESKTISYSLNRQDLIYGLSKFIITCCTPKQYLRIVTYWFINLLILYSGKIFFLSYILVLQLKEQKSSLYHLKDCTCFLFDELNYGDKVSLKTLIYLHVDRIRELWVLTDGLINNTVQKMKIFSWFVVLAASPKKIELSLQWKKNRNVAVCFMKPW